jgi:hypothetical protein
VIFRLSDNDIGVTRKDPTAAGQPGYEEALRLVDAHAVDVVLCWRWDRFIREPLDLEYLIPGSTRRRSGSRRRTGRLTWARTREGWRRGSWSRWRRRSRSRAWRRSAAAPAPSCGLRFAGGPHPGMSSVINIFDFPDDQDPSLVYLENDTGIQEVTRVDEVSAYRDTFTRIRDAALPPAATRAHLDTHSDTQE